ncbi:MAG TPA: DNA primase [Vicinamibacterales bacterium]|nr:DNA primase [Vicinamibacterales bacterium]
MPKFPQSFIDEVRAVADIVAVIQDYVSLKKAGASYKGLCPFHNEKSPSFTVNRDKGFFHCFGCNVGGDVFKFIELQEKLGFQDTVKLVAGKFGIPVPQLEAGDGQPESAAEREALLKMHDVAAAYFAEQLASPGGTRHREYLQRDRGLAPETVAALKLGWAPSSRDGLFKRLQAQGFKDHLIRQSGLVSVRDDGSVADRFRNRLMVPICRDTGSIVAFGGRALEAGQVPKYLNSPETPVYTKSRILYGLNLTKSDLRKTNFAIVVEGYFDFAQLYQAGGLPVVATCGTALTVQQAQMLRRFTPKVIINFDPDNAGQSAAERSCELLVGEGFNVNVARLPGGEDPDTFMQQHGREAYVAELQRSQPYLEFLLERGAAAHNLTRDDSRREFLTQMLGVAARIPDPAARDQFADRLAHKARVTEEVIRAMIRKAAAERKTSLPARLTPAATHVTDTERGLLWAILHTPEIAITALRSLQVEDLEGLASQELLQKAVELAGGLAVGNPEMLPTMLMERLTEKEAQMLARAGAERQAPVLDLSACVDALRNDRTRRELTDIDAEIARLATRDPGSARLTELVMKKIAIRRRLGET